MNCKVTDKEETIPIYWLVEAVTLGNMPKERKRGLIIVPPAIPKIPERVPAKKHMETRKMTVELLSK